MDYLKLHFIILLWGFTAIVGMWMSLSPLMVVVYRTLLACAGMGVLIYARRIALPSDKKAITGMLLTGILVAAHWFLFFASARISTVSICLVGLASAAFWTSLLEPLIAKRPWKWYELLLGGIVVAAMYAISQFETNYWYWWGLVMAVFSALGASLFTIINGRFTRHHHHYIITFYEMIGAFFASVVLLMIMVFGFDVSLQYLPDSSWGTWVYFTDIANLLFLALACTVYAYSVSVELMRRIPPFAVNLSVNLEPVYGMILAAVLFGEWKEMTREFYLSSVVILACVLAYPFLKRWDERRISVQTKERRSQSESPLSEGIISNNSNQTTL